MPTVRYDSLSLYIGPEIPTGNYATGDFGQFKRVQSSEYSVDIPRENAVSLGRAMSESVVNNAPDVSFGFEYLTTDGENEFFAGFSLNGLDPAFYRMNYDERDIFSLVDEGGQKQVMAFGNCVLTNYSMRASVGSITTSALRFSALNIQADLGTSGNFIPKINASGQPSPYTYELPEYNSQIGEGRMNSAISHGQIEIDFPNGSAFAMVTNGDARSFPQSLELSVDFPRSALRNLGDKYPRRRSLQSPVVANISATYILNEFKEDSIQDYFCDDEHSFKIITRDNSCGEEEFGISYSIKGAKFKSFSSQDSIENKKSVTLNWEVYIDDVTSCKTSNIYMVSNRSITNPEMKKREVPITTGDWIGASAPYTVEIDISELCLGEYTSVTVIPQVKEGDAWISTFDKVVEDGDIIRVKSNVKWTGQIVVIV